MPLTGHLERLTAVSESLRELAGAVPRASERIAEDMTVELAAEFDAGVGPDGQPWAALAPATVAKGRSAPPLTASGRMCGSAQARAERDGVAVTIDPPAGLLQRRRPIVPVRGEVPESMNALVRGALEAEITSARRRA